MDNKHLKDNWYYIIFFLIGIILLCVYKINKPSEGEPEILVYLSKEVGMAMLIAIFLVYSIERVTRQKHQEAAEKWQDEANKNLFKSIFKRYIPASVFAEVEDCLLRSKVYRDQYEITYTLREMTAQDLGGLNDEHFVADVKSSYVLKNMTDENLTHTLKTNLEVPNEPAYVQFTEISSYQINEEERLTHGPVKSNEHGLCEAEIQVSVPAGGSVRVLMTGKTVKRRIDGETWSSRLPSTGVTLFITAPDGVEVNCTAKHSKKIIPNKARDFAKTKVWELKHGVFPFQSVILYWNGTKKDKDSQKVEMQGELQK